MNIQFVEFDERFFLLSQKWLNDSEIKKLTMTPDTDENDRIAWYESLKRREDYYFLIVVVYWIGNFILYHREKLLKLAVVLRCYVLNHKNK